MGFNNSTGSGSSATGKGNGEKVGLFRRFATFIERITNKPLTKASKKKALMSATKRDSFVWEITRNAASERSGSSGLFVRVYPDVVAAEQSAVDMAIEAVTETVREEPEDIEFADTEESFVSSVAVPEVAAAATSDGAVAETPAVQAADIIEFVEEEECEILSDKAWKKEEDEFVADYCETLEAEAVIECMLSIVPEVFYHAPEYVITEIAEPEVCFTQIDVPAPAVEVRKEGPIARFVFGIPKSDRSVRGSVTFNFVAGDMDSYTEDEEDIRIVSHSTGSEAVSASPAITGTRMF